MTACDWGREPGLLSVMWGVDWAAAPCASVSPSTPLPDILSQPEPEASDDFILQQRGRGGVGINMGRRQGRERGWCRGGHPPPLPLCHAGLQSPASFCSMTSQGHVCDIISSWVCDITSCLSSFSIGRCHSLSMMSEPPWLPVSRVTSLPVRRAARCDITVFRVTATSASHGRHHASV